MEKTNIGKLKDTSWWANSSRNIKTFCSLCHSTSELQRSRQKVAKRPRRKLLCDLHTLPLMLCPLHLARYFTTPHVILSIFHLHQHLLFPSGFWHFILTFQSLSRCHSPPAVIHLCHYKTHVRLWEKAVCVTRAAGQHLSPSSW